MSKKDGEIVFQAIQKIDAISNPRKSKNAHGPSVVFDCLGMEWEYGYDSTPKGSYNEAKTRKGLMHMMLSKSKNRGISSEIIYGIFKNESHNIR